MQSDALLRGKHAVVTGGARGIGLGIAALFADRGLRVSIVSRSALAPHHDERLVRVAGDVTDEAQVAAAFDACREANGPIDVLVNNSGIAESAPLIRTSVPMWNQILATNLTGTFLCTRAAVEDMIVAKWGRVVNVASTAALGGAAYLAAYCASKHGVLGFTRAVAAEFDGTGITVNAVCPGYTETDMMRKAIANVSKHTGADEHAARARLAQTNPLGRIASVQEVAQAVFDFAAGSRNGVAIVVPGGAEA